VSRQSSASSVTPIFDDVDSPAAPMKLKRDCRFKQEWRSHGMLPSKRGPTFSFCKWCTAHISVAHGGANDVKKHLNTSKHEEVVRASSSNANLFQQSPIEDKVTRAEILFANFIAEHNLAFMAADHFTHLTAAMFPDSKIAKAFS
jgi:hypothetical protein